MTLKYKFSLLLVVLFFKSFCEKKPLTHDVYNIWRENKIYNISNDGKYCFFDDSAQGNEGDGLLIIKGLNDDFEDTIQRGYKSSFTSDNNFLVTMVKPFYDTLYNLRLKKEKNLPPDSLVLYSLKDKKIVYRDKFILDYQIRKGSDVLVYERDKYKDIYDTTFKNVPDSLFKNLKELLKVSGFKMFYVKHKSKKEKGKEVVVFDLKNSKPYKIDSVKSYFLSEEGNNIFFIIKKKKKESVHYFNYEKKALEVIDSTANFYRDLAINKSGNKIAYLFSKDSINSKENHRTYSLNYIEIKPDNSITKTIISNNYEGFPTNWEISPYNKITFSKNGNRIFFKTRPIPSKYEDDTTVLDSEKPLLDIWHWRDEIIQPSQKIRYNNLRGKGFYALYDIRDKDFFQLQSDKDDEFLMTTGDEDYFYSVENKNKIESSWKRPILKDIYSINSKNGKRNLVLENQEFGIDVSPKGNYFAYYDNSDKKWYLYDSKNNKKIHASKDITTPLYNEDYDYPSSKPPYGKLGWSKDETNFYIRDRYDIWKLSTNNSPAKNISDHFGKNNRVRLDWINIEGKEFRGFDNNLEELLLYGLDENTKAKEIYSLTIKNSVIKKVLEGSDNIYTFLKKSKDSDTFLLKKESFRDYPDIYVSDLSTFNVKRISDINPQQKQYKWGSVEVTKWNSFSGRELEGLIYKPENFDSSKKYPLLVYFYETHSDRKNKHYVPQPLWSIINIPYCISNDYVVFVPDIKYNVGTPGDDAYDCVVSGVEMMEKKGYINKEKMALQGQSWGGFQTAFLVTKTGNKFAAAMAGAPVSNTISAYGGIRWESGLSRSFQYENGQCRLGTNFLEDRDTYIKNSPIFFADKVETPLLIMHNDNDGAVPWYQGIEYYITLRRLEKPVWLLVYNGEAHNLIKRWNRKDLSIRVMQFFDHYLKDSPAPKWMIDGVSQVQKKSGYLGYDLEESDKLE